MTPFFDNRFIGLMEFLLLKIKIETLMGEFVGLGLTATEYYEMRNAK